MSDIFVLRQVAHRLIASQLGTACASEELAVSALEVFTTLLSALSPVLGQTGSTALFRRSLKLAENAVPLYAQVRTAEYDRLFDTLVASLRQQPPEVIREASETLLATYIELLAIFIGEQLTWQLLQEAWPALRASTPPEIDQ